MIPKYLKSLVKTLELLVDISNLQLDLNIEARTSQEIVPYDISSQPSNLGLYSQLLQSNDDE